MFAPREKSRPVEMRPGVFRRSLGLGPNTLLCEITLGKGSEVEMHSHPHEQIGYCVSGEVVMEIGGELRTLLPGDSYAIPGGVRHMAKANVDSVVIDIFHPVREEYLD
jgi:quercetin dioxygenase-like cupin family protein